MNKPNDYITELFHKLREDISSIKNKLFTEKPKSEPVEAPRQYTIEAVHAYSKANEKENNSVHIALNLPESIRVEAKTEERQKQWFKDRTVWIQISGILVGALVALIYYFQLTAMRQAVATARDANKLTEESVRGRVVMMNFDLAHPITAEEPVVGKFRLKNAGHSVAVYGIEVMASNGNQIVDGDMPLPIPNVSSPIEPDVTISQTIIDQAIPDQSFIDHIPTGKDLTANPATHHLENPTKTPTVFFYGRLIYESLGKRREQQFCFFVIRVDEPYKQLAPPKMSPNTDPRFDFITCSKWNFSREY